MEIPVKLKKKRSRTQLTISTTTTEARLPVDTSKLPPVPKGVSTKGIAEALRAINNSNKEEVERTRKKLRDEVHSK